MAVTVTTRGPFFAPGRPMGPGVEKAVTAIMRRGEELVKEQLTPGHGYDTGNLHDNIHGEVTDSRHATISAQGVPYDRFVEWGQRSFPGYHMFENAAKKLDDLAPGLLQSEVSDVVRGLN